MAYNIKLIKLTASPSTLLATTESLLIELGRDAELYTKIGDFDKVHERR